ncbi:alpha/beta hydrolase family protein [Asticcacaulis excentricus]|uniref:Prolyl oligopeptidase family protein n=1 Tax=Asticcacaulis excentricus TaxID=78587 RepID=A0A3G9G1D6_9CAUL|nr:S9 family peptidase [Asticcacaulis excentricus]BBF80507.1 prolyl oligopeptidase family protein [Asticcacaulis excentricus]
MTDLNRRTALCAAVSALIAAMGTPTARASTARPDPVVFARDPAIFDTAISPDGKRIAVLTKKNGEDMLFDYDLSNGSEKHTRVTRETEKRLSLPDTKIRAIFWASNNHIAVVKSFTQGNATYEHYVTNVLDLQKGTFVSFNTGAMPERVRVDDKYEILFSTARVLSRFDPATGKSTQISYDYNGFDWVVTPEGIPVAYSEMDWGSRNFKINMRDGDGWKTVFTGNYKNRNNDTGKAIPRLICLGREGYSIIARFPFTDDDEEDTSGIVEIAPDGMRSEPFKIKGRRAFALIHPQTKRFAGFSYREDWIRYDYTDPFLAQIAERAQMAMPKHLVKIVDMAIEDPRKVILYVEGPNTAGAYFFVNFGTGAMMEIGGSYPDLPADWIASKTKTTYTTTDGLGIEAYLSLPPQREAKNLPLIVLPHGGPQSRDDLGFDWLANALATRGYAILQPNFRGSSGYGYDFVKKGHGEWGRKMQTDLSDGVRHLSGKGIIDPRRVAILGASYGGYAALAGVAFEPDVYRCAIGISGVYDLPDMMMNEAIDSGRKSFTYRYWQTFLAGSDLEAISPARNATKITAPVLLLHGLDDTVVPFSQSTRMEAALKKAGKPVELVRLKGEDHWLSVETTRTALLKAAIAFLETHNPA